MVTRIFPVLFTTTDVYSVIIFSAYRRDTIYYLYMTGAVKLERWMFVRIPLYAIIEYNFM